MASPIRRTTQDQPKKFDTEGLVLPKVEGEVVSEGSNTFSVPTMEEINQKLMDDSAIQKVEETNKEMLEFLKEAREDTDLTDEDIVEYNERINKRMNNISDSTYRQLIDNIVDNSDMPIDQRAKAKLELMNHLKSQQAVSEEFEQAHSEFEQAMAQIQTEMDDMFANMEYLDLIKKLESLIEIAKKHKQGVAIKHYTNLYNEVHGILYLTPILNYAKKVKNPAYLVDNCTVEADYRREYEKFYKCLEVNKTYRFVDISRLYASLSYVLKGDSKNDASLFLFTLYRYITDSDKKNMVDKNAVFLEGLFRIIYSLPLADDDPKQKFKPEERTEFLQAFNTCIETLKTRAVEYRATLDKKISKSKNKKKK